MSTFEESGVVVSVFECGWRGGGGVVLACKHVRKPKSFGSIVGAVRSIHPI